MNILNEVHTESDLEDYLSDPDVGKAHSFSDYFNTLPEVMRIGTAELSRRSGIERSYCYQLLNGRRTPGRDKVILLSLAAGLDLATTNRCLKMAGLSPLYSRDRRDAIVIWCIGQHRNVLETNETLVKYEEPPLS